MSRVSSLIGRLALAAALMAVVGWPALATVREVVDGLTGHDESAPAAGTSLDPVGSSAILEDSSSVARPLQLATETISLVLATELFALPLGVLLAFFLFRSDAWGGRFLLALVGLAAFVPLPLHATAWLGAFGNAGRMQALGVRPILVGLGGAAVVHGLAALPWVILIAGAGLTAVEPELEDAARLDLGPLRVFFQVTLRRSMAAITAAALGVAILVATDMTVTDLLQIRTYAEESYLQYSLGRGPGGAALAALPPLALLGILIVIVANAFDRFDPARLISAFQRAQTWPLGRWRIPCGLALIVVIGNALAMPLYSLVWRAGRVGGRAGAGLLPSWSPSGFIGTLGFAADEIWEPMQMTLACTAVAATVTAVLAAALAWTARQSRVWRWVTLGILALTLALPGPVAGMALVLAYRPFPTIYDSAAMIVCAQILRTLPYSLLILWPFLRSFPQDYLDAAALDGAGPWAQFRRVVLPLTFRTLVAAWAIAFAVGLGELPATNIVTPPGTQPMSVLVWGLLHTGVESHLAGVALIMLATIAVAGAVVAVAVYSLRALTQAGEAA